MRTTRSGCVTDSLSSCERLRDDRTETVGDAIAYADGPGGTELRRSLIDDTTAVLSVFFLRLRIPDQAELFMRSWDLAQSHWLVKSVTGLVRV